MMPIFMPSSWLPASIGEAVPIIETPLFGGASDVGAAIGKANQFDSGSAKAIQLAAACDHQLHAAFS
jgi:hypothetical protein